MSWIGVQQQGPAQIVHRHGNGSIEGVGQRKEILDGVRAADKVQWRRYIRGRRSRGSIAGGGGGWIATTARRCSFVLVVSTTLCSDGTLAVLTGEVSTTGVKEEEVDGEDISLASWLGVESSSLLVPRVAFYLLTSCTSRQ